MEAASNRIEYQEYFLRGKGGRCGELTNFPLSRAEYPEIWTSQPSGTFRVCRGLQLLFFTFRDFKREGGKYSVNVGV